MMKKVDLDGVKVNTIESFTTKAAESASALRIEMQEMVQGNLHQFHLHPSGPSCKVALREVSVERCST